MMWMAQVLATTFRRASDNGVPAGCIDAKELRTAMQALGFDATEYEISKMVEDIDADGNGATLLQQLSATAPPLELTLHLAAATIEWEEFVQMMEGKMVTRPSDARCLSPTVSPTPPPFIFRFRATRT